jgi:hypothetical protein
MAFDGTIDYFRDTVFNYPTMAECYKVAAFDGLNKLELDKQVLVPVAKAEPVEAEQVLADATSELLEAAAEMVAV